MKNPMILLLSVLFKVWSNEKSDNLTPVNLARGKDGITSLVVSDLFGGEFLKTKVEDEWHYYNRINGIRYDLTSSQFKQPLQYIDIIVSKEEILLSVNREQYEYHKREVLKLYSTNSFPVCMK